MSTISYDKEKIAFLLLEGVHSSAILYLNKHGYENIQQVNTQDNWQELLPAVHFIGIRSRTQLTADVLHKAKKLLGIGCFCIGTEQVNLSAATQLGIPVFNAPYANTRSVAELVLAEAILLSRAIPEKNYLAHQGVWQKNAKNSFEVRNKALGIIGYGNIGMQVGILAESLGIKVYFYDINRRLPVGNACKVDSLEQLLKKVDIVSLHVPSTVHTRNLINHETLAMMKKNAVLINASRGNIVDIDALSQALKKGLIAGAAIDVFPQEPSCNQESFATPLQGMHNVILTPHIGGSTEEAQINIGEEVAEKLVTFCDNGSTFSAVNFPEVSLPVHTNSHRILHIHQNVPGVINKINQILSKCNVNIDAQYLQTSENIGYVVTDINTNHDVNLKLQLKNIAETIKIRFLF